MKTLAGSYLKTIASNRREKERVLVRCSREIALRQEIGFPVHPKRGGDGFSLSALSFQPKYIRSISAVPSAQTNLESEEIEKISSDQPKTVHVRFKLHRECVFGQQFLVVGDDPILGLWDPSEGVPLNWSEGHVWTGEVDIPIGKVIKFKFILRGNTGSVSWQPGPDRVLETWETEKTISVSEDWENPQLRSIAEEDPQLQSLVEEDFVDDVNEESLIDSDLSMVAENLSRAIVEEGDDAIKELATANDLTNRLDEPSAAMIAENISEGLGEQDLSSSDKGSGLVSVSDEKREETALGNNGSVENGSDLSGLKNETRLVLDEGVPVLVPGLVPTPPDEIEAEEVDQVENNIVENKTTDSDEVRESTESELKDEHVSASLHSTETSEMMVDEEQQLDGEVTNTHLNDEYASASLHFAETSEMMVDEKQQLNGKEQTESNILQSDMQWGRRTLQKFLATLGFI